jgi:NADH-quinone oxidoreductase subunit C
MLPEDLKPVETARKVEDWDPEAMTGGSRELAETLLWVRPEKIAGVCRFLRDQLAFERLSGITAIDRYPVEPRFELVYLLHSVERNERLKLKVALDSSQAEVESVTAVWPGADWYERETYDLFGVTFRNHPDLRRILMPDYWEGHPLRKDFPVHGHKYSYREE